ncbi:Oxidoreductase NAD-binding domain-containing protein 1-like [Homarus americanus]|uniref:Oxidoreductase NAD-binding domain-containing protein 1-like n=1 Tax=Homarus americanus TaxID=6706 RepID=A0A8J5TQJ5_HOMAM|nr:Oxidoreductase NAD-binding domain-containing protein 1-like [Homarus americanus]
MGLKMLTRSFRLNTSLISRDEGAGKHLKITARHTRLPVVAKAVVTDMGMESSTVRSVTLRVENPNFTFKAGQWIDMFIPGMETVGGFSMYSCPTHLAETGTLQLGIKFSRWPPAFWVHDQALLDTISVKTPETEVRYFTTREPPPDSSLVTYGHITHEVLKSSVASLDVSSLKTFICGPPPMIENINKHLLACGLLQHQILYEKWW